MGRVERLQPEDIREPHGLTSGLPAVTWNLSQVAALFLDSGARPLPRTYIFGSCAISKRNLEIR